MNTQMRTCIMLVVIVLMIAPTIANAEPSAGATQVRETDGATMVYVSSGEFLMGSPEGEGYSDEWPQHVVYLDGFWIDRTEVTNRQFEKFVAATGYRTDAENDGTSAVFAENPGTPAIVSGADWRHPEGAESSIAERQDEPVIQMTGRDAAAYCKWAGGRLPTEAEWEKAACGTDGRRYPWGNIPPNCQKTVTCLSGKPMPVGSKPEGISPYGGVDMLGNASEWVSDLYARDSYRYSAAQNPSGPASGMDNVIRGGGWDAIDMRCASRYPVMPGLRTDTTGFRCVVSSSALTVTSPTATPAPTPPAHAAAMPVRIGQHRYLFEWNGDTLDYLLFLPKDYERETEKRWPLILYLHSKNQTANGLASESKIAAQADFPFIVLSPQLPDAASNWYAELDLIDALLDQIVASYRVDEARLSVTGWRMGGEGAYLMVTRTRPDRFAAVVSIAGVYSYYFDRNNACISKGVAFWVFHRAQDALSPISNADAFVNALKACGAQVQYTVFTDRPGWLSWRVYDDPALYDWLLQQRRRDK